MRPRLVDVPGLLLLVISTLTMPKLLLATLLMTEGSLGDAPLLVTILMTTDPPAML